MCLAGHGRLVGAEFGGEDAVGGGELDEPGGVGAEPAVGAASVVGRPLDAAGARVDPALAGRAEGLEEDGGADLLAVDDGLEIEGLGEGAVPEDGEDLEEVDRSGFNPGAGDALRAAPVVELERDVLGVGGALQRGRGWVG